MFSQLITAIFYIEVIHSISQKTKLNQKMECLRNVTKTLSDKKGSYLKSTKHKPFPTIPFQSWRIQKKLSKPQPASDALPTKSCRDLVTIPTCTASDNHGNPGSTFYEEQPKDGLKVKVSVSCVCLFAIPWTLAHQAPLAIEFSTREY